MRNDISLDQVDRGGGDEAWLDFVYILESREFAEGLIVGHEQNVKDGFSFFVLNNLEDGVAIY